MDIGAPPFGKDSDNVLRRDLGILEVTYDRLTNTGGGDVVLVGGKTFRGLTGGDASGSTL